MSAAEVFEHLPDEVSGAAGRDENQKSRIEEEEKRHIIGSHDASLRSWGHGNVRGRGGGGTWDGAAEAGEEIEGELDLLLHGQALELKVGL